MPIRITGMNSGLDTESIISELVSAYKQKGTKYEKAQTKISWKQEAWKSLSSKTYSFRTGLDKMRFSSGYNLKTTSVSNASKASITASNNAVNGTQTLEIKQLAKSGYLTGGKVAKSDGSAVESTTTMGDLGLSGEGEISVNGKQITINNSTTVSEVISKLNDAGVKANFDATNQRIFVSSTASGKDADFTITALDETGTDALRALGLHVKSESTTNAYKKYADAYSGKSDTELEDVLKNYDTSANDSDSLIANFAKEYQAAEDETTRAEIVKGFSKFISYADAVQSKTDSEMGYNTDGKRIDGQDAKIILNGAEFTSTGNTFSVNGLTINALAVTDDGEELTVTTTTDNQGIYDKIKDFLSDYNDLINSMTKSYNAESSSGYDPLSDDEKEAMTDAEIEKWEAKGKGGILRRDSTLSTLMSIMTGAMSKSYTVNGKNYSLSSFGIKTLGIMNAETNEQNAYHIDGDADDESSSSNTDKLMAAIVADPEGITEFFKQISNELYDKLGEQMTSTTLRSYGSFYNDKQLESEYKSYTTKISDWDDKVQDIEDSYYKKFSKMESALASLQSQQSSLSGLLGS